MTTIDKSTARLLARLELKSHGLGYYAIAFSDKLANDGRIAECDAETKTIRFSPLCLKTDLLFSTVLKHEVAHALQFRELGFWDHDEEIAGDVGHGPVFKKYAKLLGVPAKPFVDSIAFLL